MSTHKAKETIGQRLRQLRRAARLTQEQLAQKANVSPLSLRNWEQDHRQPRVGALLQLARALGVRLENLLQGIAAGTPEASLRESPGLKRLKKAWEQATSEERKAFRGFIDEAVQ